MRNFIKGLFAKDWTIYDKVLCVTNAALLGLTVGFIFSPIRKGFHFMSGNGSRNGCMNGDTSGKVKGKQEENRIRDQKESTKKGE